MALGDSFVRVAGTVLAILKTRFELISIEVEEEWIVFSLIFCYRSRVSFALR